MSYFLLSCSATFERILTWYSPLTHAYSAPPTCCLPLHLQAASAPVDCKSNNPGQHIQQAQLHVLSSAMYDRHLYNATHVNMCILHGGALPFLCLLLPPDL